MTNLNYATAYKKKGMSLVPLASDTHRPDGKTWTDDPDCLIGLKTNPILDGDILTALHKCNSTIKGSSCTFLILKLDQAGRRHLREWIYWKNRTRRIDDERIVFMPTCEARDGDYSLYFYVISHPLCKWQRRNDKGMELFYGGDQIILPSATTDSYQWIEGREPTLENLFYADRPTRMKLAQHNIVIGFILDNFDLINDEGSEVSAGS